MLLSRFNKKVKLIADLHENYPAAIESWYQPNSFIHRLLRPIIFNKDVWTEREKQVLKKVDLIFTVSELHRKELIRQGLNKKIIKVISNTFPINFFKKIACSKPVEKNKYIVLYLGGFGSHRGLDTLVKSIKYFKDKIPNVKEVNDSADRFFR